MYKDFITGLPPSHTLHTHLKVTSLKPISIKTFYKKILNRVPATRTNVFICLVLRSSDYNMHVEGLLPANLKQITLLSWDNVQNLKDSTCKTSKQKTKHPVSKQN